MTQTEVDAPPPIRDHVTFRAVGGEVIEPAEAAADLVRHVRLGNKARPDPIRVRPHVAYSGAVTVRVSRHSSRFQTIRIAATAEGGLIARHNVALGRDLSLMLQDWLVASDRFTDICWRTGDQWRNGEPGHATPA
jgi:hypothetical protein